MASNTYASPVSGDGGTPGSYPVFFMPVPFLVARGFQILLSFIIMVMAGMLMHGLVLGPYAFALVCGLFTIIIAVYVIVTEKVVGARAAYNYWAVLSLDLLMVVFWLSSMGANAALRGTFRYSTSAECYDDGSTFNANTCYTSRRRDPRTKRSAVAGKVALAEISAIAGLSALLMLLFVATFAYLAHQVRLHLQAQRQGIQSNDAGVVEMKGQDQGQGQEPAGGPVAHGYDPDYPGYAAAPGDAAAAAAGLAPVQPYTSQVPPQQPMPYETAATYGAGGASAGYAGSVQATAVYDPHAQAAAAAYAPSQHIVSPAATPAPEYQPHHQYSSAAGPAQNTPEPYYSSQAQQQPYYPPR
ncbi:uncharacterized protein SPSK_01830 [Sporothrix schenckii 1099-18]|uniref:MARVEL domain-containing protein n=2 Tax=Sporothrix schenckii TaxID=29908 RepID=U7PKY1_SPOS1|nr:uncharacterized protein SPSK_01830 [Sporothrix schenckii 1099-18]ERS96227.1 hypothetical protein HMPREF1624_07136 [Sporothrix schenckii ATCC 58251]KJR86911.1 hypothetical protein SPSK_01830 [Sporothrix schenckii 1099-18]